MANTLFPQEGNVCMSSQSKRNAAFSVPRAARSNKQQENERKRSIGSGSAAETDNKSRPISTRRRAPVACTRCRRRKIKCSGDVGDGQSCSNCRNSGTPGCEFVRVNCSVMHTKTSCNGWPYPAVNTVPSSSFRSGIYSHMASKPTMLPANSPELRVNSMSQPTSYNMGTGDYQHALTRQPFCFDQNMTYEEDSTMPYNPHTPTYMLPGTPSGLFTDCYTPTWNPRAWYSNFPTRKTPSGNGGLYTDQTAPGHLAQSAYPCMIPRQGTSSTDIPSFFPTMTPLTSDGQGTDRTLPNPAGRHQLQGNSSGLVTMPDAISQIPFSQDFKFGNNWSLRGDTSAGNNGTAMSAMPAGTFSSSPENRTKQSPSNAQDLIFDYMPIPSNSASPPSMSSSATYTELDSIDSPGDFRDDIDSRYARATRTVSHDNGLVDYSPLYSHSTTDDRKSQGDEAGGSVPTLVNGLPYTRVRHPDTQDALSFDLLPPDPLLDYRDITEAHRTPVSPLANPGCY